MAVRSTFDQLVDQFKLERHVSQSGHADVYDAYDVDQNRPVRLEVLLPPFAEKPGFADAYLRRARSLVQLRHPNMVQVYSVGRTAEGRPYVAERRIDGYPLTQRLEQLRRQQAPAHVMYALSLVRQIAEALVLAERLGIYHYCLTPDHVLLQHVTQKTDDAVRVLDLMIPPQDEQGIAGETADAPYLPPEQLRGKAPDSRSHVFSLGAMLFELLTLQQPPPAQRYWQSQARTLLTRRTELKKARPGLAAETYALVERSLHRNPARRYRTVSAFLEALQAATEAESVRQRTGAETEAKRTWPLFLVPLLLLCALVGVAAMGQIPILSRANQPVTATQVVAQSDIASVEGSATPAVSPTAAVTAAAYPGGVAAAYPDLAAGAGPLPPTATLPPPTNTATASPTPTATEPPTATATPLTPSATPLPIFVITISSASLRSGPNVSYPVIGFLLEGENVRILARTEGTQRWYNVVTGDEQIGWVSVTVGEPANVGSSGIPVAATIPAPPPPTFTPTPLPTPTPLATTSPPAAGEGGGTVDGGDGGSGGGGNPPRPTPTPPL